MTRLLVLVLLLVASAALALAVGQVHLGPQALLQGLFEGDGAAGLTVRVLRGPRVVTALGCGAAFGVSGAIFQSLFRNPLASPDVMGFNAGAGLAILASISVGAALPMPLVAAAGGGASALFVALLSRRPGHASYDVEGTPALTLVLVGIGVGFTASAIGAFLITRMSPPVAAEAQRWLAGSLSARNWTHAGQIALLGGLLAFCVSLQLRNLRLLELGADLATGLGLRVARARFWLAASAVGLAACAVAVAGPVAFVALMAPPIGARILAASDPGVRLFAAALVGAIIVVLADLVARASIAGLQLPIGVMTGILGAPYLLWLLSREMKKGEL